MSYEDLSEVGAIVVGSDGNFAHKAVMRSIELLGRGVIHGDAPIPSAPGGWGVTIPM